MNTRDIKDKTNKLAAYLIAVVEEMDDDFFDDENYNILQTFISKEETLVHLFVKGKAVILFYYDKSQNRSLVDDIQSHMKTSANVEKPKKVQLISIVESLNDKVSVINFVKDNKKSIIRGSSCSSSNFGHNIIFEPKVDRMPIEISVSRMNSIIFPEPYTKINIMGSDEVEKNQKMAGYLFVVKLDELVQIYNKVGDVLFAENLRYGIADNMSLEKSMESTLLNEPEMFWYYNNGITIVTNQDTINIESANKVALTNSWKADELGFSVINGAQTISTASRIFSDGSNSKDKIVKAKDKAQVLLRIIIAKEPSTRQKITIALNRQKPIKPEDIAFQSAFVTMFNEYMKNREESNKPYLYIIKRGENMPDKNTIILPIFARLVYASFMDPTSARNDSAANLYYDKDASSDGELAKNYFKREFTEGTESTRESAYNVYYQELVWAYKLYNCLNDAIKKMKDKTKKTILANNRLSFVAYTLKTMSDFSGEKGVVDYSRFQENAEVLDNIESYADAFVKLVNDAYPSSSYQPGESKKPDFWEKINKIATPEEFEKLRPKDENKNTSISKAEFENFLRGMKFKIDNASQQYKAEVNDNIFSDVNISVQDDSFYISVVLFNIFDDKNEEDDSDIDEFDKLKKHVEEQFAKTLGSEFDFEEVQEYDSGATKLVYHVLSFDTGFVSKFISLVQETNNAEVVDNIL